MTTRSVLRMPYPPTEYDQRFEAQRNRDIEDADALGAKRTELRLRTFDTYKTSQQIGLKQDVVLADAIDGAMTITLPAVSADHVQFDIKKIDSSSNAVTVQGRGTETVDGSNTVVLLVQYDAIRVASNGEEYFIL